MKTFRITIAAGTAALAAVLAGAALGAAAPAKPTAFNLSFSGKAVVRVAGNKADIQSAQATGTGTPLGKATLTGKGSGNQADPCPLWSGPGTITSAKGKLNFTIASGSACTDEGGQEFALTAYAKFTSGSGSYAKAKGQLKITGNFNRGTGLFTVKFIGKLTL